MKPLSIEELKALKVGDWVWVVDKNYRSYYAEITAKCKEVFAIATYITISSHFYSEYGETWLAYKNKEYAESKSEWVELPCKIGDTVWAINAWVEYGDQTKGEPYTVTRYELVEGTAIGFGIYKSGQNINCEIRAHAPQHGVRVYVFTDKSEAERRLTELKGEKI